MPYCLCIHLNTHTLRSLSSIQAHTKKQTHWWMDIKMEMPCTQIYTDLNKHGFVLNLFPCGSIYKSGLGFSKGVVGSGTHTQVLKE
uniref:Uncharacterized protein n=1 Tax=Anguilla anguilla TaxID=7936 RepID=A0A0E9WPF3_ANGAN